MVRHTGSWNSIRETVVCSIKDKDGKKFEIRLLVDSGATTSTLPFFTLYKTRGNWDVGTIPPIRIHGINAATNCDMVCRATLSPGEHLKSNFFNSMGLPANFELEVDFLVMRGIQIFHVYKRELPESIRTELADIKYHLADPEQITEGERMIYIHGILGVKAIGQMQRKGFTKVPGTEMTTCKSIFGDLLFGASHFMPHQPGTNPIPLNDNDAWETDHHCRQIQVCSINLLFAGLIEVEEKDHSSDNEANDVLALQTSKIIESHISDLID
jgi:hypothetical protein